MKASPEFNTFGLHFIQDIDLVAETMDGLMRFVLGPFEGEARVRLRDFIDEALRDDVSDEELQRLWHSTPADIYFHDTAELRMVLREARDRL